MTKPPSSWYARNGLSLVLVVIFLGCLVGQIVAGHHVWNQERTIAGLPELALWAYLTSGHFVSAMFENWESEFLQMGMYVLLTVKLRQYGSAESRPLDPAEEEQRIEPGPAPRAATAKGVVRWLYANSLAIAFMLLFATSFVLHLCGSWRHEVAKRLMEGELGLSLWEHFTGSEFWFESFQNWQSEFLSVLALVLLSIFLRQDGSPQSKPLQAPHSQTGT